MLALAAFEYIVLSCIYSNWRCNWIFVTPHQDKHSIKSVTREFIWRLSLGLSRVISPMAFLCVPASMCWQLRTLLQIERCEVLTGTAWGARCCALPKNNLRRLQQRVLEEKPKSSYRYIQNGKHEIVWNFYTINKYNQKEEMGIIETPNVTRPVWYKLITHLLKR